MKTETDRYSDIMLERFVLGELPADKMDAIRLQSAIDESLRLRLEDLKRSDAEILAQYPAREQAEKIMAKTDGRMPQQAPRRRFIPIMALATAAAAACLVLFLALPAGSRATGIAGTDTTDVIRYKGDTKYSSPSLSIYRLRGDNTELLKDKAFVRPRRRFIPIMALAGAAAAACLVLFLALPAGRRATGIAGTDTTDVIRYKGDTKYSSPSLSIYRLRGDNTELLKDKAVVRPRDVIQVRYNALAKKYGAILSIDGRGSVTLHSPVPPSTEVALDHPEALLARSFELDDAPDFEIFFFVTADSPFDLSLIQERAKKLALAGKAAVNRELDLPEGLTQTTFLLIKEIK
jgi:hypothetical protein